MSDSSLPDSLLVADEIFDQGMDAVMTEPRLAPALAKLTNTEIRSIVSVVTTATATIAAKLLIDALLGGRKAP